MSHTDDSHDQEQSRLDSANSTIKTHIIASLVLGLVPVPVFDIAALAAAQLSLLHSLSELYEVPFDEADVKPLITALIGGSLPVVGVLGLSSVLKLVPGIGTLAGSAGLSITAGALTYAVGQVFIMHFQSGGSFEDFNAEQAKAFFAREFQVGKAFVAELKKDLQNQDADGAGQAEDKAVPAKDGVPGN